jgi:hypothetical protein
MKKSVLCISIIILLISLLASCSADRPPDITVTADGKDINWIVAKNEWNGAMYDREDTFVSLFKQYDEFQYFPIGAEIEITFKGRVPDTVTLTDCCLGDDGSQRFYYTQEIELEFTGRKAVFTLPVNTATLVSSIPSDYRAGSQIRGFRMKCSWGRNECEYAFVLLTDPPMSLE